MIIQQSAKQCHVKTGLVSHAANAALLYFSLFNWMDVISDCQSPGVVLLLSDGSNFSVVSFYTIAQFARTFSKAGVR